MPSYMTIVVLALAASNVPVALSVPVHSSREVREQSLSRRDGTPGHGSEYSSPGTDPKQADHVPPGKSVEDRPVTPPKGGSSLRSLGSYVINFVVGTAATMAAISILKGLTGSGSNNSAAAAGSHGSTNQNAQYQSGYPQYQSTTTYPPGPTPTSQNGQTQYGQQNQQRAVGHSKRTDIFEAKARYISENARRAASHLELFTRGDLGEVLKLFGRAVDELD